MVGPLGGRTITLNTDLTEEDFMEVAGAERIFIYMVKIWQYLLH